MALMQLYNMDFRTEKRYKDKISIINGIDPYGLDPKMTSSSADDFPKCNLWCIGNYLVNKTSHYTHEDFNAYKSLQAYTQFACGWVREVFAYKINTWHVVVGKVMHSMRVNEKPLQAWIIAASHGEIQSAHCSCMAGLAEACIHIAAILFYVENAIHFTQEKSVTDVSAYWTPPAAVKRVCMAPIDELDFSTKKLCENNDENKSTPRAAKGSEMSDEEYKDFLQKLSEVETCTPLAILLTESPFCDKYINPRNKDISEVSSSSEAKYPPRFRDFFREEYQKENLSSILRTAETLNIQASSEQCERLENDTREQSKSKLWFHYRAGRITASVMKRVCAASLVKPPISLIKQIVYPGKMKFATAATKWGCSHESTARKTYEDIQKMKHANFKILNAGFFISKKIPYVGATPDGIVNCQCCGKGCIEIKCPYCLRNASPEDILESSAFLNKNDKTLRKDHGYYYQIQTQLFATELQFCDLVVWTKESMFIERIYPDTLFWDEFLDKASPFFYKIIMPELLSKIWTSKKEISINKSPIVVKLNKV